MWGDNGEFWKGIKRFNSTAVSLMTQYHKMAKDNHERTKNHSQYCHRAHRGCWLVCHCYSGVE